jgi:hypothetical protein
MKRIATLLLIVLTLSACNGSKHFSKLAAKQEAAGLTTEAANSYYISLQKKRNNLDAQIGLKKNGQLVLNNMLGEFAKQKNFGSKKEAVYAYLEALDYRDKINNVGIELLLADFYEADYRQVKEAYLSELYDKGTTLLEEEKYAEAETEFNEIRKLDPNYKDTKALGDIAYLEPLYAAANSAIEGEKYREAYNKLSLVIDRKADYKNARALKKMSLAKGTYTIAMLPFENGSGTQGLDAKVSAYTLEAMSSIKDPFLKVVDREHMQAILQEQKLQLSGVVDDATAVHVGELVGAQAILTGTVLSYGQNQGQLRNKTRSAFQAFQVKKLNPTDGKYYMETNYRPVNYTEYYNANSCTVSFQYKLISLKTGEVLKSEIITREVSDEVLYGKFDGDVNTLVPANGSNPNLNNNDRRTFMNIMNGRQELKNVTSLSNDLFANVSNQLSQEIGKLLLDLVP